MARETQPQPLALPAKVDEHGVKQPGYWHRSVQARLSRFFFAEQLPVPTREEIEAANHHEAELTDERDHEIGDSRAKALAPRE